MTPEGCGPSKGTENITSFFFGDVHFCLSSNHLATFSQKCLLSGFRREGEPPPLSLDQAELTDLRSRRDGVEVSLMKVRGEV